MSDEHPPPPPELRAPIRMWRDARALLVNIWTILGNPEDLAQTIAVSRKLHRLYASWLRVAEAVLRHLLMIEAAALGALGAPLVRRSAKREAGAPQPPAAFLPDQPQTWRVSFRCRADRPNTSQSVKRDLDAAARLAAGLPLHARVLPTQPLALRYAAVLRVFNDPIPYARRLARRLHAQPQLARTLLLRPPEYIHRIDRADDITDAAERAWPPPTHDSS